MYGEQPHVSVPQASTTKIATTLVALERSPDLNRRIKVTISASAMVARDGSSTMGIEPGRTIGLDTLLYGMMLPSGNDAAEQVAVSIADSREQFIGWMNDEAMALGLNDTVVVQVTLDSHTDNTLEKFGETLAAIPEVIEAYLVSGEYDYLLRVAVKDTRDYERLLREKLYKIKGIRHSKSSFVLRTLKKADLPL